MLKFYFCDFCAFLFALWNPEGLFLRGGYIEVNDSHLGVMELSRSSAVRIINHGDI